MYTVALALATRQIQRVTDFDWLGFLPGRYQRWGARQIELEVLFTDEEIAATRALFRRWVQVQPERSQMSYSNNCEYR